MRASHSTGSRFGGDDRRCPPVVERCPWAGRSQSSGRYQRYCREHGSCQRNDAALGGAGGARLPRSGGVRAPPCAPTLDTTLTFEMSLETLDDIVFDDGVEDRLDLFQSKHHVDRSASLTDASTDVWKTIRNWIEDSPPTASLTMLTTAVAPDGSAMSFLRGGADRDVERS